MTEFVTRGDDVTFQGLHIPNLNRVALYIANILPNLSDLPQEDLNTVNALFTQISTMCENVIAEFTANFSSLSVNDQIVARVLLTLFEVRSNVKVLDSNNDLQEMDAKDSRVEELNGGMIRRIFGPSEAEKKAEADAKAEQKQAAQVEELSKVSTNAGVLETTSLAVMRELVTNSVARKQDYDGAAKVLNEYEAKFRAEIEDGHARQIASLEWDEQLKKIVALTVPVGAGVSINYIGASLMSSITTLIGMLLGMVGGLITGLTTGIGGVFSYFNSDISTKTKWMLSKTDEIIASLNAFFDSFSKTGVATIAVIGALMVLLLISHVQKRTKLSETGVISRTAMIGIPVFGWLMLLEAAYEKSPQSQVYEALLSRNIVPGKSYFVTYDGETKPLPDVDLLASIKTGLAERANFSGAYIRALTNYNVAQTVYLNSLKQLTMINAVSSQTYSAYKVALLGEFVGRPEALQLISDVMGLNDRDDAINILDNTVRAAGNYAALLPGFQDNIGPKTNPPLQLQAANRTGPKIEELTDGGWKTRRKRNANRKRSFRKRTKRQFTRRYRKNNTRKYMRVKH